MIVYVKGDIFASQCQTLVNPVNTVGVMGSGLAKAFKTRFPAMFVRYAEVCAQNKLSPGMMFLWKGQEKWVLNFPTKTDWRAPSRLIYVQQGLDKFIASYRKMGITSAAFPALGCGLGGLEWEQVGKLMSDRLNKAEIDIEIYLPV